MNRLLTTCIKVENAGHAFYLHVDHDLGGAVRGLNYSSRHESSDMHSALSAVCSLAERLLEDRYTVAEIKKLIPCDGSAMKIFEAVEREVGAVEA